MISTPVTVFTGFLGSGKTTQIIHFLSTLPKDYKTAVLKNEFGSANTDSLLLSSYTVTEMINGCLCCTLVGQMQNALEDIKAKYNPDRIVVETSGSAFPAPIALQIRQMDGFHLDSIVTVVDTINFRGYEDTSYTAKMQAKYTDLILLSKWELLSERELDLMLDHVYELNPDTPKIKFSTSLTHEVVFGLDTKLFQLAYESDRKGECKEDCSKQCCETQTDHHQKEIDTIQLHSALGAYHKDSFEAMLDSIKAIEDVYRIKGVVQLDAEWFILNWAFGRYTLTVCPVVQSNALNLTVMGVDLRLKLAFLLAKFNLTIDKANLMSAVK